MAVKVMWAPALRAQGDDAKRPPLSAAAPEAKPARKTDGDKPKRRKTSIYDGEGNEVFITLMCLKCHQMRPLSQFGLRKMADGAIRNQPWCRPCRSDASPKKKGAAAAEESSVSGESLARAAPVAPPTGMGNLAAQVATALYRGRG
jgi:hypothetical protein